MIVAEPLPVSLTPREREVVTRLATGASPDEIAAQLSISRRTVEYHRQSAMDKLNVHSREQLGWVAARAGFGHDGPTSPKAD